jgi:hypothetical protein
MPPSCYSGWSSGPLQCATSSERLGAQADQLELGLEDAEVEAVAKTPAGRHTRP